MNERRRRRALITRPQEDSADVAIALARRGITPVLAPMMRIEYAPAEIENEVGLAQAILFTSRNGVRAFARLSPRRDMPAFAVGESTAALARDNGFVRIESAGGDSADLARLVAARLKPEDGLLFHAAGTTVAGDLVGTLNKSGFKTVRRALYETKPVDGIDDETAMALRDRTLDYVLFFSPRTGRIFAELVIAAGLEKTCDSLTAICLSEAVESEISRLPWKTSSVAAMPTTDALMSALGEFEGDAPRPSPAPPKPAETPAESEGLIERAVETTAAAGKEMEPPEPAQPDVPGRDSAPAETSSAGLSSADPSPPDPVPSETPDIEANTEPGSSEPDVPESDAPADPPAEPVEDTATDVADPAPADTAAQTSAAPRTEPRKPGLMSSLPMAAGIAAAALAAAYLTLPMWRDHLPPGARERLAGSGDATRTLRRENTELKIRIDDLDKILVAANKELTATRKKAGQEIGDLKSRLAASDKTTESLRTTAQAADKAAADNAVLTGRVSALEKELAAANAARAAAVQQAKQAQDAQSAATEKAKVAAAALNSRIATLEKQVATARAAVLSAGKADTIALAAGKLRDALARAAPFPAEVTTLKRLGSANPDIATALSRIESFAAKGVASRSTLFANLPAAVDEVLEAARTPTKTGWIDRAAAKLTGFVTIRRIDGKGDGADAILARAEIAARRGDLAAAVKEMSTLTGPAAMAAEPWLSAAKARLAAEAASADLDKIVLTVFAKGAGENGAAQ